MIHERFRYKVQGSEVYVNLNDILHLLQSGQDDPDLSLLGKNALETVERAMLKLGIHALRHSTLDIMGILE